MKLRKVLASTVAASVAMSAMVISASAATVTSNSAIDAACDGVADAVIVLKNEDGSINLYEENGVAVEDVYGLQVVLDITAEVVNGADWVGGGMGANSESTGWLSVEWGQASGAKPIVLGEDGVLTWLSEAPVFSADDTYNQLWIQAWGIDVTVKEMNVLGADGSVLFGDAAGAAEEAPADEATDAAAGAECAYIDGTTPSYSYTVAGDVETITAVIKYAEAVDDGNTFGFNDWCANGVIVTMADGSKKYYQWGGKEVGWGWDADGDGTEDAVNGAKGETWLGSVDTETLTAELVIPVEKGAVVDFLCLGWDTYAGTQFTVAITGDEAAAEDDAAADEDAAEDDAAEDEAVEEDADDEDVAVEVDWDAYDEDAMAEANEAFVFGESTAIDIYSVVGDAWEDIAVIEADFVWTPGTGWCGGAGIGNGAVAADGSTWISGPEYGCANANQGLVDDGKATQVLADLTENPLTAIASVDEEGNSVFGHIQVQNWWNGVEAGAQMAAIRFLDADGEVLGELTYDVEAPEAPVEDEAPVETPAEDEAPATGAVDGATDSSKGSPDTGIEDVAVVAGLAIVAAGAVLVSKKRK